VSLFREEDGLLLAGDAFATMDLDSWASQVTHARELSRPPAPFTTDWAAAQESIAKLAELEPQTLAAGHGRPLKGGQVTPRLRAYARHVEIPLRGRYAGHPAQADRSGVVAVPHPAPDRFPLKVAAGMAAATVLYGLLHRM
jgi:glyoxylase-like metal-dependent hydrolase (beta-lactamase superfamily II)